MHLRSVSWGCPDASLFKGCREITIAILQARKRSQRWQQDQCESTEVAKVCAKCSQTLDLSDGPRFCQMGLKVGYSAIWTVVSAMRWGEELRERGRQSSWVNVTLWGLTLNRNKFCFELNGT